jgi:hypothetical protein
MSTPHTTMGFFPNSASENLQSSYYHEQDTHDTMVNVYVISSIKYLNVFGEIVVLFKLLAGVSRNVYVGSKQYYKVNRAKLTTWEEILFYHEFNPLGTRIKCLV